MNKISKLSIISIVFVSCVISALVWETCSHSDAGTYYSYDDAEKYCWVWCGVRVMEFGQLTKKDKGGYLLEAEHGIFHLSEASVQLENKCFNRKLSIAGVVKRLPFAKTPEFVEVEYIAVDKVGQDRLDFFCFGNLKDS